MFSPYNMQRVPFVSPRASRSDIRVTACALRPCTQKCWLHFTLCLLAVWNTAVRKANCNADVEDVIDKITAAFHSGYFSPSHCSRKTCFAVKASSIGVSCSMSCYPHWWMMSDRITTLGSHDMVSHTLG